MKLCIHVIRHLADRMLYVENKMVLALVLVYKIISAILISDVDLNAFRIPIVLMIKLVSIRNVWTLVRARVAKTPFVMSLITLRFVHVLVGTPAMRWLIVIECHLVRNRYELIWSKQQCNIMLILQLNTLNLSILAVHLHVDRSVFVVKSIIVQFVRVNRIISVDHQIVDQNALHHLNALEISHA